MLLPVWITSLPKFNNWQWHYDQLVHQTEKHKSPWKPVGNNFLIDDSTGKWDKFYDLFLEKTQEILGPIELLPENSRDCWCYPSNKLYYRGGIHDHKTTSVIIQCQKQLIIEKVQLLFTTIITQKFGRINLESAI